MGGPRQTRRGAGLLAWLSGWCVEGKVAVWWARAWRESMKARAAAG